MNNDSNRNRINTYRDSLISSSAFLVYLDFGNLLKFCLLFDFMVLSAD